MELAREGERERERAKRHGLRIKGKEGRPYTIPEPDIILNATNGTNVVNSYGIDEYIEQMNISFFSFLFLAFVY